MNTYESLQQKALGLAFILAPLLMAIGAAAYALGIGTTPSGDNSWVTGTLWSYGFLIMIPVVIKLSSMLGQRAPILGLICLILGMGWGMSIIPAAASNFQTGMIALGINESMMTVMDGSKGTLLLMLPSLLSIVGMLLLGIGFLTKGGIPRWAAGLLMIGSVLFFIGIISNPERDVWQATVPAFIAFLAALAPIGLQYLSGRQASTLEIATA